MLATSTPYHPARAIPKEPLVGTVTPRLLWHRWREPRLLQGYQEEVASVCFKQASLHDDSLETLQEKMENCRLLARKRRLYDNRAQLLATVALLRELSKRLLGQEPYPAQLIAALAMFDGHIVQLAPGEGKTLTIGVLAVLYGWDLRPCHILTANDYLAARDAKEMKPLYAFCKISVGTVLPSMTAEEKRAIYACDIVYATAKQLLADFLTDRIRFGGAIDRASLTLRHLHQGKTPDLMMRGLHTAIVDEADNILVDEAVTPMIISQPEPDTMLHQAVLAAKQLAEQLRPGEAYLLDEHREVRWLAASDGLFDTMKEQLPPGWRSRQRVQDIFSQAVLARDYFQRDKHYVVLDDADVIVYEGTGRTMPGRSWSYGLHQAIEARAGVPLSNPSRTLARMSFQNFFKQYSRLCGASGTLQTIAHELYFNYRTMTLHVPSRLPPQLRVQPFMLLPSNEQRLRNLCDKTQALHTAGIPVLLGTRTIADSERLGAALSQAGIPFQLLNAKQHAYEAEVIAGAGNPGVVTVATNMAGRGTDIKVPNEVLAKGGLRVLMLEPHESARVDWQLFGRAGRQGNSGEVFAYATPSDELFKRFLPAAGRSLLMRMANHSQWRYRAAILIRFAQWRAQLHAFQLRRMMNHATRETRKGMTFVRDE
jgi:preprotein translocase subunit SecA